MARSSGSQRDFLRAVALRVAPVLLALFALIALHRGAHAQTLSQTDIPGPPGSDSFGANVTILPNGNFVVVDALYDAPGAADAGSVSLYDGATLELIGRLTGSTANDQVGSGGITVLTNGNFVVASSTWNNGAATQAGAATWVDGALGLNGVVSPANSLVGSTTDDLVSSSGITALGNGNFVVASPLWDSPPQLSVGAVTWGNGVTGTSGAVSTANSLVGMTSADQVGSDGVTALPNGYYVVLSPSWRNGGVANTGAVTWADGDSALIDEVSAANSLVGDSVNDSVGSGGIVVLPNDNFLVRSPLWNGDSASNVGALTWVDGETGLAGVVSVSNSLIGASMNDSVASNDVTILTNGNYVAITLGWDNGATTDVGAVTWGSGETGATGVVSVTNSLVGSTTGDLVGNEGVTPLANGNYVVVSTLWDNGGATDAGAVTWGDGTSGMVGTVDVTNSLVGITSLDQVGAHGITTLGNGNYVVRSLNWDFPIIASDAGAVTWGSGTAGVSGEVSHLNSLVGFDTSDQVGSGGITVLTNDNYVVASPDWDLPPLIENVGAVTWGDGASGSLGIVSELNSLAGWTLGDRVGSGGVTPLPNGNYVVHSPEWDDGGIGGAGAVTWGNGAGGLIGYLSSGNSLVGSSGGDQVGLSPVTVLSNGNYVVAVPLADPNGIDSGAVTWANGNTVSSGPISAANSLVGAQAGDAVGSTGVTALTSGNYVVGSVTWRNGASLFAGAATWGNGATGTTGVVSSANSLVGSNVGDYVGFFVTPLPDGNYVVGAPGWRNDIVTSVGAVTWGDGATGTVGAVTTSNSLFGGTTNDFLGANVDLINNTITPLLTALPNSEYIVHSPHFDGIGTDTGAISLGNRTGSTTGVVSTDNSVLGSAGSAGASMISTFNPETEWVAVGRPADNFVTIIFFAESLTVGKTGSGTGSVESTPEAIDCGSTCTANIGTGKVITLTATPDASSTFTGWSGDCTGVGACTVTMSQTRNVTATFTIKTFNLTVQTAGNGSGSVTGAPANPIAYGTVVTLTAVPNASSIFTGWSGDCSGTVACVVTMTQARSVVATFDLKSYALTVNTAGSGSGSVTGAPTNPIAHGTVVTLTANAAAGSTFAGWSGDCGGFALCVVTMNSAKSVTATFLSGVFHLLTVNTAGTGSGTVSGASANPIAQGTVVTLTANAAAGSVFAGWSGDCSGNALCVLTMDEDKTVTATFTLQGGGDVEVNISPDGEGGTVTVEVVTDTVAAGAASAPVRVGGADESYPVGTVLRLTAVPWLGYAFDGWGGDASGMQNPLEITVVEPITITAVFEAADVYLPAVNR